MWSRQRECFLRSIIPMSSGRRTTSPAASGSTTPEPHGRSAATTPPAASNAAPPAAKPVYELPPHPLLVRLLQPPDAFPGAAHGNGDRDVASDRAPPRPREHPGQRDGRRRLGTHRPRAPAGRYTSTASGREVCRKYNAGTCRGWCRLAHVCHQCLGRHPAQRCHDPTTTGLGR